MSSSRKKISSNSAPANVLTSKSQSRSQSPRQNERPRWPVCTWSAHVTSSGTLPSPFPRHLHALSATATTAGEWFFFGGIAQGLESNDLYLFSTRDFSTTLLQTSGDIPSPRIAPAAVLTGTTLLIWGGKTSSRNNNVLNEREDDSLYLLNLLSRKWTRVVVDGPRPVGRYDHTVTMVGSKFFIFGGNVHGKCFNDIWAFDLNSLNSKPAWESYEPAPKDVKPLPRNGHVSVTTGNRIIIFGGSGADYYNDTWSFEISTRKWTELRCTGSIPSPRAAHAAVLIDDVMYVFGGLSVDGTCLGDLTAFNLSTQQWSLFQNMGPSPSGRCDHVMASDGTRAFVLGGLSSKSERADETTLIHVVDTSTFGRPSSFKTGHIGKPRHVPKKVKFAAPGASSEGEVAQLEHERIVALERQLSSMLEQAKANASAVEAAKRAELELRKQADQVLVQTSRVKQKDAELVSLQAKLDNLLLSRTQDARALDQFQSALHKAKADADEQSQRACEQIGKYETELVEVRAELRARKSDLEKATSRAAEADERSQLAPKQIGQYETELAEVRAELQAKISELEKATSRAAEADQRSRRSCEQTEQYEKKLTEVHTELEVKKSELKAVRLRLTGAENGWAKSKAEAETFHTPTAKSPNIMEESQITHRLLERVQAMEAEIASLRWNEKSFEMMECRNEG